MTFFINCKSKDNIDFSSIKNMILYEHYTIKYYTNMYTNTTNFTIRNIMSITILHQI